MECAGKGCRTRCLGPPKRLCNRCRAVTYCSVSHQLAHSREHREECVRLEQQMKRVDDVNEFPFEFAREATIQVFEKTETRCSVLSKLGVHRLGMWLWECSCGKSVTLPDYARADDGWKLPCEFCPCRSPASPLAKILTSWKDYYEWSLSIHYLGPERELTQLAVFGELGTLFPGLQVKIEMFGPAISAHRDGTKIDLYGSVSCNGQDFSRTSLTNCSKRELEKDGTSGVTIHLRRGLYHERFGEKNFVPDIIIAPNAGVAAYQSWLATIELIKEQNMCAIFSDYCEEACHLAAGCMSRAAGISLTVPIQLNPFRQPMAVEDSAFCLPCYSNCFLFGI